MTNKFKEHKDKTGKSYSQLAKETNLSINTLRGLYKIKPEGIPYVRLKVYITLHKIGIDLAEGIDWGKIHNLTYKKYK